jgi:hypothetical protein
MAPNTPVKNVEETQKLDSAVAEQLAKAVAALRDLED